MEHFIGIDVAKDRLDVHIRPNGESFTLARDGEALAALAIWLAAPRKVRAVAGRADRLSASPGVRP
jgi:hypothetical protein